MKLSSKCSRAASDSDGLGLRGSEHSGEGAGGSRQCNESRRPSGRAPVLDHPGVACQGRRRASGASLSGWSRPIRRTTTTSVTPICLISSTFGCADPLRPIFPELFATARCSEGRGVGRDAIPPRWQGESRGVLPDGMTQAMHRLAEQAHPAFPVTIYYAFKQAETDDEEGSVQHRLGNVSRRCDPCWFRYQRYLADAYEN